MTFKRHEEFAQKILTTYPEDHVCLACNKKECVHEVRLKIFLSFINAWADIDSYEFNEEQKEVYRQCIDDIYQASKKIWKKT